jgi:hypothetical protein
MNDNVEIKLSTLIRLSIQRWKLFIIILILTTSLVFSFNYIQKQKFTNLLVLKSPSNFYSADYLRTQRFLTLLNQYITKVIDSEINDVDIVFRNQNTARELLNTDLFDMYLESFHSMKTLDIALNQIQKNSEYKKTLSIKKISSIEGSSEFLVQADTKSDLTKAIDIIDQLSLNSTKKNLVAIFESRLNYQKYLIESILEAKILKKESDQFKYISFFENSADKLILKIKETKYDTNYIFSESISKKSSKFSSKIAFIFSLMISLVIFVIYITVGIAKNHDEKI